MNQWYYADGNRQRLGPVDQDELVRQHRAGHIALDALVWRDGLSDWRPLREFAAELGLLEATGDTTAAGTAVSSWATEPAASPYAAPESLSSAHAIAAPAGEVVLAGFWKRLAAMTIDSVIMTAFVMIGLVICVLLVGGASAFNAEAFATDLAQGTLGVAFILGFYVVPIFIQAIYFSWMHAAGPQATLGKMAIGIKVARGDGQALTLGRSFGRWCAYFFINLLSCGLGTFVSAFTTGLTQRKQALHDMMADTLVVDKWAFTAHPERQRRELGTVTWVVIVLAALLVVAYFGFLILAVGMAAAGR